MPEALIPQLLMRLARKRRRPRVPDPADMGTAFGLEYVLDQAADHAPGTEAAGAVAEPSDWFHRWLQPRLGR